VASPAAVPAQNLVSRGLDKINAARTEVVGAEPDDARSSFTDLTSKVDPARITWRSMISTARSNDNRSVSRNKPSERSDFRVARAVIRQLRPREA